MIEKVREGGSDILKEKQEKVTEILKEKVRKRLLKRSTLTIEILNHTG